MQDIPGPSNNSYSVCGEPGSVDLKIEMCKFGAVGIQMHGYLHFELLSQIQEKKQSKFASFGQLLFT